MVDIAMLPDLALSAQLARESAQSSSLMMNWRISTRLFLDDIADTRDAYRELYEMRKKAISARLREAFARVALNTKSDLELIQLDNGLIETSSGYYALLEDKKNGVINVVWSREQKHLLGESDPDGINRLSSSEYVYYVGKVAFIPRKTKGNDDEELLFVKSDLRRVISQDHNAFIAETMKYTNLHAGDVSDVYESTRLGYHVNGEGKRSKHQIFMFSNDGVSYTIADTNDGKWILQKYAPYSRLKVGEAFVEITNANISQSGLLKHGFTNGFELGKYDTQHEAFIALMEKWNIDVQEKWRGKNFTQVKEAPYTVLRTMAYDATIREIQNPENVEEGIFDSVVTASPILWLGARALGGPIGFIISSAILSGFGMRKGLKTAKWAFDEVKWAIGGANWMGGNLKDHIAPDRPNYRRIRKKLHPDFIKNNRLLGINDLPVNGITVDGKKTEPAHKAEEDFVNKWLLTANNKGMPSVGFALTDTTILTVFLNGLIQIETRDPKTRDKTCYASYIEEMDLNDHVSIPSTVKKYLIDGKIRKVEHLESEDTITGEQMHITHFYSEAPDLIEKNSPDNSHLSDMETSVTHATQLMGSCETGRIAGDTLVIPRLSGLMALQPQS